MLVFVIICNLLLTLLNLYVLNWIWQWRRKLAHTHRILEQLNSQIQEILRVAPEQILASQQTALILKKSYQQGGIYLQQIRQLLILLGFVINFRTRSLRLKKTKVFTLSR